MDKKIIKKSEKVVEKLAELGFKITKKLQKPTTIKVTTKIDEDYAVAASLDIVNDITQGLMIAGFDLSKDKTAEDKAFKKALVPDWDQIMKTVQRPWLKEMTVKYYETLAKKLNWFEVIKINATAMEGVSMEDENHHFIDFYLDKSLTLIICTDLEIKVFQLSRPIIQALTNFVSNKSLLKGLNKTTVKHKSIELFKEQGFDVLNSKLSSKTGYLTLTLANADYALLDHEEDRLIIKRGNIRKSGHPNFSTSDEINFTKPIIYAILKTINKIQKGEKNGLK